MVYVVENVVQWFSADYFPQFCSFFLNTVETVTISRGKEMTKLNIKPKGKLVQQLKCMCACVHSCVCAMLMRDGETKILYKYAFQCYYVF